MALVEPQEVLVNRLVKLAQEKSLVKRTDRPDMTIAVDWDVKHQTKQTNVCIDSSVSSRYVQNIAHLMR